MKFFGILLLAAASLSGFGTLVLTVKALLAGADLVARYDFWFEALLTFGAGLMAASLGAGCLYYGTRPAPPEDELPLIEDLPAVPAPRAARPPAPSRPAPPPAPSSLRRL